uniref:hypothetical protein n=1 Tax=Streptomyces sp. NRRL F-2664 TaxID=1463842 RepID=UPI00131BF0C6
GTDYTPARLYHRETGRFTTRDPHPTPLNKYQAFAANPVEHTDPSGNLPFKIKIRGQGKRAQESRQRTQALESARKGHYESSASMRLKNARGRLVELMEGAATALKASNWPEMPAFTSKVPAAYQNYEEALASYKRITGRTGPELFEDERVYITAARVHADLVNQWFALEGLGIELQKAGRAKREYDLFEASLKEEGFSSHVGPDFQDFALSVVRETLDQADESEKQYADEIEKQYIEARSKLREDIAKYTAEMFPGPIESRYLHYVASNVHNRTGGIERIAEIPGV